MLLASSLGALWPAPASSQTLSPYLRGVPTGTLSQEPLALTIADAVQRALAHNLGIVLAEQRVDEAGGALEGAQRAAAQPERAASARRASR